MCRLVNEGRRSEEYIELFFISLLFTWLIFACLYPKVPVSKLCKKICEYFLENIILHVKFRLGNLWLGNSEKKFNLHFLYVNCNHCFESCYVNIKFPHINTILNFCLLFFTVSIFDCNLSLLFNTFLILFGTK